MRFRVLGPVAHHTGESWVQPGGELRRRLLAVLLARAGQQVPGDMLWHALWPGAAQDRAKQRLHVHIHRLRNELSDPRALIAHDGGYELRVLPGGLDAQRFEDLARTALSSADETVRAEAAHAALQEWPTDWSARAYEGVDVPICRDEAERLEALRFEVAEVDLAAAVRHGRHLDALADLSVLARLHPLRETVQALLMRALHQAGRRNEALEVYRSTRRLLVRELGLEPSADLAAVQDLVLTGTPADQPPLVPAQLPGATEVVGRGEAMDSLAPLLGEGNGAPRVAVICGPPGVGKSALSLRWAHENRDDFPDGQLFVDLHGYSAGAPIAPERALNGFIRALGGDPASLHDLDERAATYRSLLAGRRALVVLDNARDVEQVRPLLPGTPGTRVLVTSRERLSGLCVREDALHLALPGLDEETAVSLLRGSAAGAHDDPAWTDLARRCGYMPLMLKLAGERVREDPGALAALSDSHLDGTTLDLWDLGDRRSSAREVLSWSLRAVPPDAVTVFTAIGLARSNAVDVEGVAALAGLDHRRTAVAIAALRRAHLAETEGRWVRQHDLVAAYACECADDLGSEQQREASRVRLLACYAGLVREAIGVLEEGAASERFADGGAAREWLLAALGPLMAAIDHAPDEAAGSLILISRAIPLLILRSGNHEIGRALHTAALEAAARTDDPGGAASAHASLGSIATRTGDHERARQHLIAAMRCADAADNPIKMAVACNQYGIFLEKTGRLQDALDAYRSSAHWCEQGNDAARQALALGNVSFTLARLGRLDEAEPHLVAQVEELVGERTDHLGRLPEALGSLAWLRMLQGRPTEAIGTARRALEAAAELGAITQEAEFEWVIGMSTLQLQDPESARRWLSSSAEKARLFRDDDQLTRSLVGLATVTAATDAAEALGLLDDAVARSRRVGMAENEARALAARAQLLREGGELAEAASDEARSQQLLAQCGLAQV